MNIEWKVTEQESQQEMVSGDGRWHITKNQKGNQEPLELLTLNLERRRHLNCPQDNLNVALQLFNGQRNFNLNP